MKVILAFALLAVSLMAGETKKPLSREVFSSLDIAPVWSAHPVGFCLLTHAPFQYVAFYDADRRLTVAQRGLDEEKWKFHRLPVTTGWDSHNYITMTVDGDGFLHLSGDMHCVPLKYFRTTKPLDASTFERLDRMTGELENRVTYPVFMTGPKDELIFTYRHGSSGDGIQIFNVYDLKSREWKRLLDRPLFDGEGKRNAYFHGPVKGRDGYYHLAWVWRETPDAATNHDLSYARSRDLRNWENAAGKELQLPVRLGPETIVDPVPEKGGLINGNTVIGFDHKGRVTISYHKHDRAGNTQPWTARLTDGKWDFHQITDWKWRWDFGGGGTLGFGIRIGAVTCGTDGRLTQDWSHVRFGGGTWLLDPESLRAVEELGRGDKIEGIPPAEGDFPGMQVKTAKDTGRSDKPGISYLLRWETLPANRDLRREGPLPGPSMLRLVKVGY